MVPVRAASNMAAMFRPSSPFNGLKALSAQQIEGIGDTLVQGVVRGYHPMRVAREITQNVVGVPEARAATIARTEIMRAYRTSSTQFYTDNMYRVGANGVASGVVTGWVWECSAGSNTCAACYAMSGQTFPADAEMDSHPNCLCMQIHTTVGWDGEPDGEGATTAESMGIQPGEDVFAALSDAEQLAILGLEQVRALFQRQDHAERPRARAAQRGMGHYP